MLFFLNNYMFTNFLSIWLIGWLIVIDFNGMSTRLRLFYAKRLSNRIQRTSITTLFYVVAS